MLNTNPNCLQARHGVSRDLNITTTAVRERNAVAEDNEQLSAVLNQVDCATTWIVRI